MKLLKILFLIIFSFTGLFGQSFEASVSNTKPPLNDPITVTFTLSGQSVNGVRNFRAPDFGQFIVLSGPNTSSSYSSINGAVSMSVSYSFVLQAKNLGKAVINPATIEVSGKMLKTKPLSLEVVKGSPNSKSRDNNTESVDLSDKVFIRAIVNKQTAYQGEEVKLTYKLYTRLRIADIQVAKLPFYKGFWSEEFQQPKIIDFKIERYNNKDYRTYELKTAALFPTETGELTITPLELNIPVYVEKQHSFFNDPFFTQSVLVDYKVISNTTKIKVLPLPEEGKPASFSGAVGSFKIKSNVDTLDLKTNQPFTYTLTITGNGNIKLIEPPALNLPSGFELLDPVIKDSILRNGRINGTKEISYIIIPHTIGTISLEPNEFSYFDPDKKEYVTLSTPAHTINVKQGIENDVEAGSIVLDKDIRGNKIALEVNNKNSANNTLPLAAGFVLPAFILAALIIRKKYFDNLRSDEVAYKNMVARKLAVKKFASAKKLMKKGLEEEFYTEISSAFTGYLMNKLNIPNSEISIDKAIDVLVLKGTEDELICKIRTEMERSNFIRFTPGSKSEHMQQVYDNFLELIIELEKRIA